MVATRDMCPLGTWNIACQNQDVLCANYTPSFKEHKNTVLIFILITWWSDSVIWVNFTLNFNYCLFFQNVAAGKFPAAGVACKSLLDSPDSNCTLVFVKTNRSFLLWFVSLIPALFIHLSPVLILSFKKFLKRDLAYFFFSPSFSNIYTSLNFIPSVCEVCF